MAVSLSEYEYNLNYSNNQRITCINLIIVFQISK